MVENSSEFHLLWLALAKLGLASSLINVNLREGALLHSMKLSTTKTFIAGLFFTFDAGQVAPRVFGAQTVMVPYKIMTGLLSRDTVIANCVNRKARCLTSHLLTGGFLDEASATGTQKSVPSLAAV